MRGLHEKALLTATLFGLPMLSIDLPAGRGAPPQEPSIVTSTNPVASNPGFGLGLAFADVTIGTDSDDNAETVTLTDVTTENPTFLTATYFAGEDGVVTNPGEPAVPLFSSNVTVPGIALRGIGWRGGDWNESQVVPLTGAPATEIRGVHTPFSSTVNFPMRLASANYFGALEGDGQTRLNVVGAQHRVDSVGDIQATIRRFDGLDLRLFYSANTTSYTVEGGGGVNIPALSAPPQISDVRLSVDGADVVISARVVGDPAAGIQEVWALTTDGATTSGTWAPLDLVQNPVDSTLWTGRLTGAADVTQRLDVIVQAANGVGLVSLDDNFGSYYRARHRRRPARRRRRAGGHHAVTGEPAQHGHLPRVDHRHRPARHARRHAGERRRSRVHPGAHDSYRDDRRGRSGLRRLADQRAAGPTDAGGRVRRARTALLPSGDQTPFSITKAATSLTLTTAGATRVDAGVDLGVDAVLVDAAGSPLKERTVYFRVERDGVDLLLPIITDFLGQASLPTRDVPPGDYTVSVAFLGAITGPGGATLFTLTDSVYLPASNTTTVAIGRFDVVMTLEGPSPVALPSGQIETGLSVRTLVDTFTDLPVDGATITFTVDPDGAAEVYQRMTGPDGTVELGTIELPLGTSTIDVAVDRRRRVRRRRRVGGAVAPSHRHPRPSAGTGGDRTPRPRPPRREEGGEGDRAARTSGRPRSLGGDRAGGGQQRHGDPAHP